MRVLFDQGTPAPLRRFLIGHVVNTAFELGWDTLANGELLRAAEDAGLELLLTSDKQLAYQQNLTGRSIAIVVLGRNRWSRVKRAVPDIVAAVDVVTPGSYSMVDIPE